VATIVAGAAIVAVAANQATHDVRPLGQLDPAFNYLRSSSEFLIRWLDSNAVRVGVLVTAVAVILTFAAALSARRGVAPIVLFAAGISVAAWGEVLVLSEQLAPGIALFAAALVIAVLLGLLYPLPGRDAWMTAGALPNGKLAVWEYYLVAGLTLLALIIRVYGLNETPASFENEMMLGMLASRSPYGVAEYAAFSMKSNTNGFMHLVLQLLTYEIFDTSVFSLRLTGGLWTTATLPLFYWLLRRIGGVGAAVIGTLLLLSAPEQLFWARCETVCVALLAIIAIVTVVLSMRLIRGAPVWVLLLLVLWIPLTRYFYSPAIMLPFYCILVYAHSLVFVRGQWRTLLRVVPVLGLGLFLWFYSLVAANAAFSNGNWEWIDPRQSGGVAVWRGEGNTRAMTTAELVEQQAANLAKNLTTVGKAMTYTTSYEGWYRRQDPSLHPTWVNVAVIVTLTVGIGYLLGQLRDPRAFALLLWVAIGVAPGVLSMEPVPRRMGLAFPGIYAVIAVTLASAISFFETRVRRGIAIAARVAVAGGLALVVWTSIGSHFLLPMQPTYLDEVRRVSRPIFAESDIILYSLSQVWGEILAFVQGEAVFKDDRVICIERITPPAFLSTALMQKCAYDDTPMRYTIAPARREELRSREPEHVSFLVGEYGVDVAQRHLLQSLFPNAPASWLRVKGTSFNVLWVRVDRATADGMRKPILHFRDAAGAALASQLLAGVSLAPQASEEPGIRVDGGMVVPAEGWYTIAVEPACEQASLEIDGQRRAGAEPFALPAGVHRFSLTLPGASACSLPLGLNTQRFDRGGMYGVNAPILVAPAAAEVEAARAPALVSIAGFKPERLPFVEPAGSVVDIGTDANGSLFILRTDGGTARIRRLRSDGAEEANWQIDGEPPSGMSVAPDGTVFVVQPERVTLYSRDGRLLSIWKGSAMTAPTIGHLANGDILVPMVNHSGVWVLDRNGKEKRRWMEFKGGPGRFLSPGSVGVSAAGDVVVLDLDGTVLLFRTPLDHFAPIFMRSFRIDFYIDSNVGVGWSFDGTDGMIVPDPVAANVFAFRLDGARVMARRARDDLTNIAGDPFRRVVVTGEGIYTLDTARRLQRFVRLTDENQS